jgi:hypothetical protein
MGRVEMAARERERKCSMRVLSVIPVGWRDIESERERSGWVGRECNYMHVALMGKQARNLISSILIPLHTVNY